MKNGVLMSVEDIAKPFVHLVAGDVICPTQ
jgi:hypothetical protein